MEAWKCDSTGAFSSPYRGSLISMIVWILMISASMFSSPYRGSLISISRYIFKTGFKGRSRPLIGVLLSQCVLTAMTGQISVSFSSPYRGSLISIMKWNIVHECDNEFSSPYRGSLISILSPTPPKTQGFHPPFAGQTRK